MNFRITRNRYLSRFPPVLLRKPDRYWDYALHPFWDEMNCGVAQNSVYSFAPSSTPHYSESYTYRSPARNDTAIQRDHRPATQSSEYKPWTEPSPALTAPSSSSESIKWIETPTCHIFRADVPGKLVVTTLIFFQIAI
jgi:hypothetical protein